jgi:hypothetical protein
MEQSMVNLAPSLLFYYTCYRKHIFIKTMFILIIQVTVHELRNGVLMGKSVGRQPFATTTRTWKDINKKNLKGNDL